MTTVAETIGGGIRGILETEARSCPDKKVACMLSGGIDSVSVLLSLLAMGKTVTCYTFHMDGVVSTDFKDAEKACKVFGVQFVPITLPSAPRLIRKSLMRLHKLGCRSKIEYECGYPMLHTYPRIRERHIFTGLAADGLFCISKKGILHFKDNVDTFRNNVFANERYCQQFLHDKLCALHGTVTHSPYKSKQMQALFVGTTWDEINKPKQKQPIRCTYPDQLKKVAQRNHNNYQLADSCIASSIASATLNSSWNTPYNYKSTTGIFNRINNGDIK